MLFKRLFVFAITILFFSFNVSAFHQKDTLKYQSYVVSIKQRSVVAAYGEVGSIAGTGFIIDVKDGIIATNAHVAGYGKVISEYLVTFNNGREIKANLLYIDPWLDFAFLKFDPKEFSLEKNLSFEWDKREIGKSVTIIGKNENKDFSLQTGTIANLYEISGELTQQAFRISLNAQGGASGSPVIDDQSGSIIGILFASDKVTSAFAIPISFLNDALVYLKKQKTPPRFHCGELLVLMSLDDLCRYYDFPKDEAESYRKSFPNTFNKAPMVSTILKSSPAFGILEVGDVIISVNGEKFGCDLYKKEKIINEFGDSNKEIALQVIRYGKKLDLKIKPYNLNSRKIEKVLVFAGATFFEVDDFIIYRTGIDSGSIFITNSRAGSSFSEKLPIFPLSKAANIHITKLANEKINSLDDLIKIVPILNKKGHFDVQYRNFGFNIGFNQQPHFSQTIATEQISISEHDGPCMLYEFDNKNLHWNMKLVN